MVGSWLTIAGHPERHVAEVLGHSLQSITRRYAHLGKGSLRSVLDDLVRIEAEGFREHEKGENSSAAGMISGTWRSHAGLRALPYSE